MYKTQMEAAKKGILTKEMKSIAESEAMDEKILMQRVASGEIAIPANKNHSSLVAKGVGSGLSTKINVNLGISKDSPDVDKELEKVKVEDFKARSSEVELRFIFCSCTNKKIYNSSSDNPSIYFDSSMEQTT